MNKKVMIALSVIVLALTGAVYFFSKNDGKDKQPFQCLNGQMGIYEHYKNAVVLVKHTYTYSVSIKGGKPFILEHVPEWLGEKTVSGTGFFVSKDGVIVTNHHVVEPWKYDEDESVASYLRGRISEILPDTIADENIKSFLEEKLSREDEDEGDDAEPDAPAGDSTTAAGTADASQPPLSDTTRSGSPAAVFVAVEDISVTCVTKEISVALHGTNNEWLQCKVLDFSPEDEVDIATIQLESERLPREVKHIVDLSQAITTEDSLMPGRKAILIGYPLGETLANTRRGILVQAYEGQINKESDGVNIQYNITSTHGASGSPVFDECGRLIAVNYAGFDQTQGYNFGIVAKYAQAIVRH